VAPRDSLVLRQAIELLRTAPDKETALRQLEVLENPKVSLPASDGRRQLRGRSFYDRLIAEILERVKQGVSREALVSAVIDLLRSEHSTDALGYIVIEAKVGLAGNLSPVRVLTSSGFHKGRIQNFEENQSEKLAQSRLAQDVLANRESIEFLPTELVRGVLYNGEFDELFSGQKGGVWLCAVPLPNADVHQPSRMLVGLYPVLGDPSEPSLPRGAPQEWRIFVFLSVAYELLNHQLTNVADLVSLQRREIIADLAPGIVNHEINQQLTILDEGINVIHYALEKISKKLKPDDQNLIFAVNGLKFSYSAIERLHRIGDAFNNLDRRAPNVRVSVRRLLSEICTLAQPRLARFGVRTIIDGPALNQELLTDPALIEHVVLNVLINALDAFAEAIEAGSRVADPTIHIHATIQDRTIVVVIANNGPPFTLDRPQRIFERGITTKPLGVGHGLGLHVCRLVMTYLGGEIEIAGPDDLPKGTTVGFRIVAPLDAVEVTDVLSSSSPPQSPQRPRPATGRK
jgi:signal transduction histidine kinase